MTQQPLFSIIIPCFNAEEYISECLDSILQQSFKHYEVICLDDNSTDNTVSIIEKYMISDKRVQLIKHESNVGPGRLRNEGIKLAIGEYLTFCDSDDFYENNFFTKLANAINKNNDLKIIEFKFNIYKNTEKIEASYLNRGYSGIKNTNTENIMLATGNGNKCYKRDFIINNCLQNCVNNSAGEEIPMNICAFLLAQQFYYLNEIGYNWRFNKKSLSRNPQKNLQFFNDVFIMLKELKNELLRLNLYKEDDFRNYANTIMKWHIHEKQCFNKNYFIYVLRCNSYFRKWHIKHKSFLKIVLDSILRKRNNE